MPVEHDSAKALISQRSEAICSTARKKKTPNDKQIVRTTSLSAGRVCSHARALFFFVFLIESCPVHYLVLLTLHNHVLLLHSFWLRLRKLPNVYIIQPDIVLRSGSPEIVEAWIPESHSQPARNKRSCTPASNVKA